MPGPPKALGDPIARNSRATEPPGSWPIGTVKNLPQLSELGVISAGSGPTGPPPMEAENAKNAHFWPISRCNPSESALYWQTP